MNEKSKSGHLKQTIIALVCLAAAAAVLLAVWRALAPRGEAGAKTVAVQVVHGDGSTRDFTLEGGVVEDNQSAYGLYILTADGETADEGNQEWWKVTKGGQRVDTGADSTPIADGDAFELTLTVGYDGL